MPLFYHKHTLSHTACLLTLLIFCAPAQAAPHRIVVPHGHGIVYQRGVLHGIHGRTAYRLHARRGQHLALFVTRGGPNVVMLHFPKGGQDGAPGGISDVLPQTGDYRIIVTEHQMGQSWNGPFILRVTLSRAAQSRLR